ncbi:MAG: fumarylacetoacetate hydrolase, partial [Chloroflexota bacterium]|nr:fumarylacetoacetate hydrolase [Chloroflexota bacterium]
MQIIRYTSSTGGVALGLLRHSQVIDQNGELCDLLHLRANELRAKIEDSVRTGATNNLSAHLLAPIGGETEVWAAGVTYKQSAEARKEESGTPDIYAKVYTAQRPELFFKATPRRVADPDAPVVVRADSTWDVPE